MNSIGEPPERRPPPFELSEGDIRQAGDELLAYHQQFAGLFFRQEQGQWGLKYLQGLVAPGIAKTMEGIALAVEAGQPGVLPWCGERGAGPRLAGRASRLCAPWAPGQDARPACVTRCLRRASD